MNPMRQRSGTFKWGILGAGKIAGKFASDLKTVQEAELYAVGSRDLVKAEEFAREYKFSKSYGSYEELVNDEEVDIIYVATPHVFHYEHTLLCLKNRKAVLCEKPFAMNILQVEAMIATAIENEVFLMEAMWTYFLPHYRFVLDLVKSQKYGKLLKLEADFGFTASYLPEKRLYNKNLGGGSLLDIGIYPVFAALSLMGIPEKISANANLCSTGVDEDCAITFEYEDGKVATLSSTIIKTTPTTAKLIFEKAIVEIRSRFHEPTSILIAHEGKEEVVTFEVKTRGYNFEAIHVQEMIGKGRTESTVMTFDKSRELIRLLDSIREKIGLVY